MRMTRRGVIHLKDVPRTFFCPECIAQFDTPEELGKHLERHYDPVPVGNSKKSRYPTRRRAVFCPGGCGRFFEKDVDQYERKMHFSMCDGSAPIGVGPQLTLVSDSPARRNA